MVLFGPAGTPGGFFEKGYKKSLQLPDYLDEIGLDEIGLEYTKPQGSYFMMVDISKFLAKEKFAGWTDTQFCEWMIINIGVAAVPGSSFFKEEVNHLIRLHFARSKETLDAALSRLAKLQELL